VTPPVARRAPALEGAGSGDTLPIIYDELEESALERLLSRGRVRSTLFMLGPAFVASIAYVDPGNFATNVQGGARFGYLLLWVVLAANLVAMVIQYLSAKLGIVTDHNYPEVVREHFPRAFTWAMWVQAEIMAMSTDLAEFIGAAIGLNLLFGVPLFPAGLITGVIAFGILAMQARGFRKFELAISALLGIIFAGFLYETLRIGPSVSGSLHGLIPSIHGTSYIYIAVGIVGATVMPHVIYLHSALTNGRMPTRDDGEKKRVLRFERLDVYIALGLAGLVNLAMLAVAAKLFHTHALSGLSTIQQAHAQFGHLVGGGAALAFAVALLASGASSSSVGTYAGQVVMAGFINFQIPLPLRRMITMIPALTVLAIGLNPTGILVLSQVVLSFGIPVALVPLVIITGRRDIMGVHANRRTLQTAAWTIAIAISAMNVFLIYQQVFTG
jgi:manganese transport protein